MTHEPALAVVVPTRDRPTALAACLAALDAQVGVSLDVVVVDDASVDADAVAAVVAAHDRARLVRGAGRGPAAARNLGAAHARAPYVCFTDDDCRPGPAWLATLHARLSAGARVVAGPTRPADAGDAVMVAAQTITNFLVDASYDARAGTVTFAPTSNLACTVDVHRTLPFDEDYPLAAGEDRDWCDRLADLGIAIAYEPAAWVDHAPDLSLRTFWRQQARYGRGAYRYHRGRAAGPGLVPRRFHVDLVRTAWARGARVGALVALAQVATATGAAREMVQVRSRRGSPGRSA